MPHPLDPSVLRGAGGEPVETLNDCAVAVRYVGDVPQVMLLAPPLKGEPLEREKALRLAAWIVVVLEADELAPERGPSFAEILEAVRNT